MEQAENLSASGLTTTALSPRDPLACDFVGNSDIYGIGIRIGFYLQTTATALSIFIQSNYKGVQSSSFTTNQWFGTALLIALCYTTAKGSLFASEIYVASILLVATFHQPKHLDKTPKIRSASSIGNYGENGSSATELEYTLGHRRSLITEGLLCLAHGGCIGYLLWYWFKGVFSEKRPGNCQDYAFFFARVRLDGWVVWPMRVYLIYKAFAEAVLVLFTLILVSVLTFILIIVTVFRPKFDTLLAIVGFFQRERKPISIDIDRKRQRWDRVLKGEWIKWILVDDGEDIMKVLISLGIRKYRNVGETRQDFEQYYATDGVVRKLQASQKAISREHRGEQ